MWMFDGRDEAYALKVGVNRAVLRYQCDFWSCIDDKAYRKVADEGGPLGSPVIFSIAETDRRMKKKLPYPWRKERVVLHEECSEFWLPVSTGWRTYSATAAIALAHDKGATAIDLYGADLCGRDDYDGTTDASDDRSDGRWKTERKTLADVCRWLHDVNIRVRRIRGLVRHRSGER